MAANQYRHYIAFVDGGCTNNGQAHAEAYGSFVVFDITNKEQDILGGPNGAPIAEKVQELFPLLESRRFRVNGLLEGQLRPTNNMAEAASMYSLLTSMEKTGIFKEANVDIYCDSELIVKQMKGIYRISNKVLQKIHPHIRAVMLQIMAQTKRTATEMVGLHHYPGDQMKKVLGH
ncbi:hypothetical protein [Desulfuromonas sp. CSMB_57]|uniref:hypothetical protein n=1 Tax=Desulfuromonas sp. CSMB_57 TaxID=2807629 RepID=UPI001CD4CEFD|nr:hypothetical protein [Desulfuromonas sp. CSMB_57]